MFFTFDVGHFNFSMKMQASFKHGSCFGEFGRKTPQQLFSLPNTVDAIKTRSLEDVSIERHLYILRIGALTGCHLCRESHPLCRLKNPSLDMVTHRLSTCSPEWQSTPADNTLKRVWQYIEKEKGKKDEWELLRHKAGQEGKGKFYWKIPLDDATREK